MLVNMKLSEIMARDVETVSPNATLQQTAEKMKTRNVGVLPVIEGANVVGVITDRDVTLRAVASGVDVTNTKVGDFMTRNPACTYEDQTINDACQLMEQKKVRRLIVLNRDGKLAGVVSLNDVALKGKESERSAQALSRITQAA
jgi:CBS domain-containing protein